MVFPVFLAVLLGVASVQTFPTLVSRQDITPLTTEQIDHFNPYTNFASAAFCDPKATLAWNCAPCANNSDFKPVASGGDGISIQFWYVGFSPTLETVIVAHQGTKSTTIYPLLTDLNVVRGKLDPTLFPGVSRDIEVHHGFRDAHVRSTSSVLSAVQMALSKYGTSSVTMVGHSLGAALSLLDSVYLPLHLPQGTTFSSILYGLPRVGNQAFANYVDANLHIVHINNMKDPIPTMPGMFLGYVHPAGEVHITESGDWEQCPGQDNPSTQCIVGDVPIIFFGKMQDHRGPYNSMLITCLGD